ncbi:hypothetical protein GCM10027073_59490 [Streptomyces chlorus]
MVVDDQHSDTLHKTPFPMLSAEQGTTPSPEDDTDTRTGKTPEPCPGPTGPDRNHRFRGEPPGAARPPPYVTTAPPRIAYPSVSPPERRRPPPALFIRVRTRAGSGRLFAELALLRVYGEPHVSS